MLSNQFARYLQLQASIDNIPPEKRARTEAEMSGLPHELPNPPASRTPATLEFALLRVIAQDGSVLKEYDARKENVQVRAFRTPQCGDQSFGFKLHAMFFTSRT